MGACRGCSRSSRRASTRSASIAARNELTIRFVDGGTYVYGMVPRSVFDALLDADSPGGFVNQQVKPRYPVRSA